MRKISYQMGYFYHVNIYKIYFFRIFLVWSNQKVRLWALGKLKKNVYSVTNVTM